MFIANRRALQHTTEASMAGKVCVVSGSTSGVGLQAVKYLARGGAQIVMLCRNEEKAAAIRSDIQAQQDVRIDIVRADFSILEEVRQAADILLRDYPGSMC